MSKCGSFKRGPLSRAHPGLCEALDALGPERLEGCAIGGSRPDWRDVRQGVPDCDERRCHLEEMVWGYARKNLAMLNIFIKVSIIKERAPLAPGAR